MNVYTDAELNYWGDRFVSVGLVSLMKFESFMDLPPARRERQISAYQSACELQERIERSMPDAALHGAHLVEPIHHGVQPFRIPGAWRRRRHA
jgi:hypothetical protein